MFFLQVWPVRLTPLTGCVVGFPPQAFLPRVLGMYVIAALAFIFYVSKVPERYFPGEMSALSRSSWWLLDEGPVSWAD